MSPYAASIGQDINAQIALTLVTSGGSAGRTVAQVESKIAIQFGKVQNQISHTFRHIEAAGLERSAVQSAVRTHLQRAASQVTAGKPFNSLVEVGGQRLQYTAFKLPDGTLNVGRIHPVP